MSAFKAGKAAGFGHAAVFALLLIGGIALGSAGLGIIERRIRPNAPLPPIAGRATDTITADDHRQAAAHAASTRTRALQTGLIIATAIGLHNFAEGLAIGVSARAGQVDLATVLIIGFALHKRNRRVRDRRPARRGQARLALACLAGLIGDGRTLLGSIVGYHVTSQPLELVFYAVAGGAIFYVIGEIWHGMRRYGHRELGLVLLAGGILTDLIVAYGGG